MVEFHGCLGGCLLIPLFLKLFSTNNASRTIFVLPVHLGDFIVNGTRISYTFLQFLDLKILLTTAVVNNCISLVG